MLARKAPSVAFELKEAMTVIFGERRTHLWFIDFSK
jgi:hypothetical protein